MAVLGLDEIKKRVKKHKTPDDLMPMLYPRSSLFRAGLLLLNTKTDPGYSSKRRETSLISGVDRRRE